MSQNFQAGDYLIFQIESGYGLLRILAIEEAAGEKIWHLAAYNELFLDVDMADAAIENPLSLTVSNPHIALTTRAFESTQVARMTNKPLTETELKPFYNWKNNPNREVSDRSVRLMLGLR
ncbi:MAG: hypothetical protein M3033_08120 [Acidobacteriota bacterium]|nr:hypothetical protein [Acidobacteriota bacterium]